MKIEKIGIDKKGYFKATINGELAGIMTFYMEDNNVLIIEHTKVEDSLKHENIGWKLLKHLINFVREKNYKVIPNCSYAKRMFHLKKDIQDVLLDS